MKFADFWSAKDLKGKDQK